MVLDRVALTGASGMVGQHVLSLLYARGISCIACSRNRPTELFPSATWESWDLLDCKSLDEMDAFFKGAQAFLHIGAKVPVTPTIVDANQERLMFEINVRSCLTIGRWSLEREIPVVFLSSASVYDNPDRALIEESDPKGFNVLGGFYGLSKWLAEQIFEFYRRQGLRLIILRPSSIYGSGLHETKMIATMLRKATDGQVIEIKPPLEDRFHLIHADDVANAMLRSLEKEAWGVFNIDGAKAYAIAEIAQACIDVTGCGKLKLPTGRQGHGAQERFGLLCDKACDQFAFQPAVDLHQGLREMLRAQPRTHVGEENQSEKS